MDAPSITIVMPAFNEEANLEGAAAKVRRVFSDLGRVFEIVIVDDGSRDGTAALADRLAAADVRVIHHPANHGLGAAFRTGVAAAQMDYVMLVPGDGEIDAASIAAIVTRTGEADLVLAYIGNPQVRPWTRRVASRGYTLLLNALCGLRLRYYNGPSALRTASLRTVPIDTSSFAYMSMILVRLLRRGCTYVEVPFQIDPRRGGRSKALRPRNLLLVLRDVGRITWSARISEGKGRRQKASPHP